MKLRVLFENEDDFFNGMTDDQIAEFLAKNCKQFLQKNPETFLFRGVKEQIAKFSEKETYANRKPRDSSPLFASHISSYFKKTFGVDYRTDHTVFCSQSQMVGKMYGKYVYAVFPIDEYTVCYSTLVEDLYTLVTNPAPWANFSPFTDKLAEMLELSKYEISNTEKHQLIRYFIGAISANPKLNTESGDEAKVQKFLNSIDSYLIKSLKLSEEQSDEILVTFKDIIENKTEEYVHAYLSSTNFVDGDVIGKVKDHNEIMLRCKKYVSLPAKSHDEFVRVIGIQEKAKELVK